MTKTYEELVNDVVQTPKLFSLTREDIINLLIETRPIWFDGHFELLSKKHSDSFFRFASITQYPYLMGKISREILGWIKNNSDELGQIDVVLSTSKAGMLLAYDIARELNGSYKTRAVYADCDGDTGYPTKLQDGFTIDRNEKVLVVNDLTTTGDALQNLIDLAKSKKGKIIGVCVFAIRKEGSLKIQAIKSKYKSKFHSVIEMKFDSWTEKECPLCAKGEAVVLSKDLNSLALTKSISEVLEPLKRVNTGDHMIYDSSHSTRFNQG